MFGKNKKVEFDPSEISTIGDLINVEYKAYLNANKKDKRAYNFGEWLAVTYPNALIYKRKNVEP